jgi:hypothetical protein
MDRPHAKTFKRDSLRQPHPRAACTRTRGPPMRHLLGPGRIQRFLERRPACRGHVLRQRAPEPASTATVDQSAPRAARQLDGSRFPAGYRAV